MSLRFRRHDEAPPLTASDWDMIGERTIECPHGLLVIQALYSTEQVVDLPVPAGLIRLRVSVRGRLSAEEHLIEYWSVGDEAPSQTLVGPDEFGIRYLSTQ
ncbi:hypothetical protein V5P93_003869 [Actinokineospora auranticolor]|uniref:hypothetical protein n=1 Tax=Actinokineospora auranticolor TaxID=155976 RepID=UPI000CEC57F6|nr:hypothetical protein [Actinokineospora auranticolor]